MDFILEWLTFTWYGLEMWVWFLIMIGLAFSTLVTVIGRACAAAIFEGIFMLLDAMFGGD